MSNPEIALFIEKEHLRDAEESDYMLMENLIQRRYDEDEEEGGHHNPSLLSVVQESREFRNPLANRLRRASAIEDDISTSQFPLGIQLPLSLPNIYESVTSNSGLGSGSGATQRQDSGESNNASDILPLINQPPLPQRPSIVIDSSQLPIQREVVKKADSKGSLHMQSETMC